MQTRTAKDDKPGVHRLTDMVTEEVSVVDRAANRRKFLVVKAEGGAMPGQEVVQGANGQLTAGQQAAAAAANAGAGSATTTTKATASLTKDAQDALASCIEECSSLLEDLGKQVDGAKIVETPEEMDASAICDGLMQVGEDCEDACYALTGMDHSEEAEGEPPAADGKPPETPNAPAPPLSMSMGKRFEVLRAKRVLARADVAKMVAQLSAEIPVAVAKLGAKMRKERLARFEQAMNLLSSVMSEVRPVFVDAMKAKKKPPAGKPSAGSAATTPQGPAAGNPPPPAMSPTGKTKKDDAVEVAKALQAQVETLQVELKKRNVELGAKRAEVPPPNAGSPERVATNKGDDGFSWPSDMNQKRDPENTF